MKAFSKEETELLINAAILCSHIFPGEKNSLGVEISESAEAVRKGIRNILKSKEKDMLTKEELQGYTSGITLHSSDSIGRKLNCSMVKTEKEKDYLNKIKKECEIENFFEKFDFNEIGENIRMFMFYLDSYTNRNPEFKMLRERIVVESMRSLNELLDSIGG